MPPGGLIPFVLQTHPNTAYHLTQDTDSLPAQQWLPQTHAEHFHPPLWLISTTNINASRFSLKKKKFPVPQVSSYFCSLSQLSDHYSFNQTIKLPPHQAKNAQMLTDALTKSANVLCKRQETPLGVCVPHYTQQAEKLRTGSRDQPARQSKYAT